MIGRLMHISPLVACLTLTACAWTGTATTKISVVRESARGFRHDFYGMKVIAIAPPSSAFPINIEQGNWQEFCVRQLQKAFAARQFLTVTDSKSISVDLEKFRNSGAVRPKQEKKVVQSIGADGILYLDYTGVPKWECERTQGKELKTRQCFGESCDEHNMAVLDFKKSMSVKTVEIPFTAMLVDTRNGMISKMTGTFGELAPVYDFDCMSDERVMSLMLQSHADYMALKFSPGMGEIEVELETDVDDCEDKHQSVAKSYLTEGISYAIDKNFRKAREPWLKASEICNGKSAGAHWNLGIYFWMAGDLKTANNHIKEAIGLGGKRYERNPIHKNTLDTFEAARSKG